MIIIAHLFNLYFQSPPELRTDLLGPGVDALAFHQGRQKAPQQQEWQRVDRKKETGATAIAAGTAGASKKNLGI